MRNYFTLIVFALLLLSCSKEESLGKEENNFHRITDFRFFFIRRNGEKN